MLNRHIAAIILAIAMIFAGFNLADNADSTYAAENNESNVEKATVVDSGTCGSNLKWELDSEGTLTISGTGAMTNYGHNTTDDIIYIPNPNDNTDMSVIAPFYDKDDIKKVVLEQGVTSTGNYAFYKCDGITEVVFPETGFTSLGSGSFRKCTSLEEITIPDTVTYYGGHAFMDDASLKKVNIPDGIKTISNNTFTGCESLTEIHIPETVTTLGVQAFWKCYNLEEVNIPEGVTEIPKDCFNKCYALKEIKIPEGVTSIGTYAFRDCTSFAEVKLPEGIKIISAYMFYGCTNLEKVNVPDGVTEIGDAAFRDCSSLKEIKLPDSITKVGTFTFKSCASLEKANVPAGLTSIGYAMFSSCKSLKEVSIPDSITKIEDSGFYECESLETIDLPNGITEIEQYAFARSGVRELDLHNISDIPYRAFFQCANLEKLTLADKITSYSGEAFRECESLEGKIALPEGITKLASREFYKCYKLEEITVPDSVTEVGDHAFAYCESIEEISIPNGVTKITDYLFYRCKSLKEVTLPKELENAAPVLSEPNVDASEGETTGETDSFDPDGYKSYDEAFGICVFYECENLEKVNLPKGLTVLPYATFCRAYKLKEVEIPDTVTILAGYCFEGCNNLNTIDIPDSVTSIETGAFYLASGLTELTIPEGITKLPMNFAAYCTELKKVTLPKGITEIKKSAFSNCDKLVDISLPEGLEVIGNQAFRECRSLTELKLPSTVKEFKNMALFNCHALEEINLPSGLTRLGDSSLYGCSSIREIVIPEQITNIEPYVLWGCGQLEKVTFLGDVTSIGQNAFAECSSLKDILLPKSVNYIGDTAFERCYSLEKIVIPSAVTKINTYTFSECSSLKEVTLSESTTELKRNAFAKCTSLRALTMPRSLTTIGLNALPKTIKLVCYKDSPSETYAKEKGHLYAYKDGSEEDNLIKGTINTESSEITWCIDRISGNMIINCNGHSTEDTELTVPWETSKGYIESVELFGDTNNINSAFFTGCSNIKSATIYDRTCDLSDLKFDKDIIIHGFSASTAESFAKQYGYEFKPIDDFHSHEFGEGTEIKPASCEEEGAIRYTCNICNFEKEEPIEALKHTYETTFEHADMNKNGFINVSCTLCGIVTEHKIFFKVTSFEMSCDEYIYNGEVQQPSITVRDKNGDRLLINTDYDLDWQTDCKNAGTHTVKVIFKGNYQGETTLSYIIDPAEITNVSLSNIKYTYNSEVQQPSVTAISENGDALLINTDYDLDWQTDCKNAGTHTVKVIFKGNYLGETTLSYIIDPAEAANVSLSKTKYTYNGKVQKPSVTVRDKNGNALLINTDYDLDWQTDCKNAGKHKVKVIYKGNYKGSKTLSYEIKPKKITSAALTYTKYTYNGKSKKPSITVKADKTTLAKKITKSNNNVTITYGIGRTKVGTYKVTVKGKGNYTGTITKAFKITPKGTTISSMKAKGKNLTVKWKKQPTQTTGYQIKYSRYPSMKLSKTATVKSYKSTSTVLKNLYKNKKYYVQIRTYKKVNGKTYYSAWSKYKTVRSGK